MRIKRAMAGGIVGGIVVLCMVWLTGWSTNVDGDLTSLVAALVFRRITLVTWALGLLLLLVGSAAAGLAYAALFEWVAWRGGVATGLALSVPHVIAVGLAVGFVSADRLAAADVAPPGAFYEYRGLWCAAAFVLAHLAFGVVVGALYGESRHAPPAVPRTWHEVART